MAAHNALSWKRVTVDELVFQGPCVFHGYHLTPDGAAAAEVHVYDGVDAGGRRWGTLRSPATQSQGQMLAPGLHFSRGIFVDVVTAPDDVTVFYHGYPDDLCHLCKTLTLLFSPPAHQSAHPEET